MSIFWGGYSNRRLRVRSVYCAVYLILLSALVATGCSEDVAAPDPESSSPSFVVYEPPDQGGWVRQNGAHNYMYTLWGSGPADIYSAGVNGSILHGDGSAEWDPEFQLPGIFWYDLWGANGDTVFAVGGTSYSICCPVHSDVGVVYRNIAGAWSQVDGLSGVVFSGVWGSAGDDVYVVGNGNPEMVLLHGDGLEWEAVDDSLVVAARRGTAVWGSSAQDVFVAGSYDNEAYVLHFDGTDWTRQETPGEWITSFWGSGPDEVYATDRSGQILYFDGSEWISVASLGRELHDIVGFASGEVFASGRGIIVEKLGDQWVEMSIDTPRFVTSLGPYELYPALWGPSPDRMYCTGLVANVGAGSRSAFTLVLDGGRWRFLQPPVGANIKDMWGVNDYEVYAVGYLSCVLRFDGSRWRPVPTTGLNTWPDADGIGVDFVSVWADGPDNIIAGTSNSLWRFDGTSWTESRPFDGAEDLCGTHGDTLYAIEYRCALGSGPYRVMRTTGDAWEEIGSLDEKPLLLHGLASGAIFVTGYGGSCHLYDGVSWTDLGAVGSINFAAWGSELDGLLVGGYESRRIHRYTASGWQDVDLPISSYSVRQILGRSADDLHILSDRDSEVFHFDGDEWRLTTHTAVYGRAGWTGEAMLFAAGGGQIHHRHLTARN